MSYFSELKKQKNKWGRKSMVLYGNNKNDNINNNTHIFTKFV